MINKIKSICKKIISKLKDSPIMSWLLELVFWELLLGTVCSVVSDNKMVVIFTTVILAVDSVLVVCMICGAGLLTVEKIRKEIKDYSEGKQYSVKEEVARRKRIGINNRENEKIRVGFYCDGGQFWSTFSDLYDLMCRDSRFEPIIIAAPETFRNEIYHYDAIDFLNEKELPYIKAYDNGKWFKFKTLTLDYVFYNRHYLSRQSKYSSFKEARKYSKICYIPYAICPQAGSVQNTLCGFGELRAFDFLFSENDIMTRIYTRYKNAYNDVITRIETVGSPKFRYAVAHAKKEAGHDKKYVQSVLYTPRWCFNEKTSSFFDLKEYFFNLVRDNENIEYIFRPHPLMKQTVEDKFGSEFWEEFMKEFDKYENAYVDLNADYMESFSKASVLVSDLSTMMFEFSITEKPVIYMHKVSRFNDFGKAASKGYYYCCNEEEVDNTLRMLREGKDKFAELRAEVSRKLYYNEGVNPVEQICDILVEDHDKN